MEKEKEKTAVVVDIGTSKIVAMAAKKDAGLYCIYACESRQLETEDAQRALVRRGVIIDPEGVGKIVVDLLRSIKRSLEEKKLRVERAYIGFGGQGLHTEELMMKLEIDGVIAQQDIDSLKENLRSQAVYPKIRRRYTNYFLDGRAEISPIDKSCRTLETSYRFIVGHCSPELKAFVESRSFGIKIEDLLVSPEGSAFATLEDRERITGCALVEMGAGVTTVSIYHDKELKFMSTIPLGGLAITNDLCRLGIPFAEAESYKINYGVASLSVESEYDAKKTNEEIAHTDEEKLHALNNAISWRAIEIVRNVDEQILNSGFSEYVNSIVLTGGGSALAGIESIFSEVTHKAIRKAEPKRFFVKQSSEETHRPGNAAVIGMLALASEECCSEIIDKTSPVDKQNGDSPQPDPGGNSGNDDNGGGLFGKFFSVLGKIKDEFNNATAPNIRPSESMNDLSPEDEAIRQAEKARKEAERQAAIEKAKLEREAEFERKRAEAAEKRRIEAEREAEHQRQREIKKAEDERKKKEKEERKRREDEAKRNQPSFFENVLGKLGDINDTIVKSAEGTGPSQTGNNVQNTGPNANNNTNLFNNQ
jgi:cell division protein FtsA